jgi:hypothetical protein
MKRRISIGSTRRDPPARKLGNAARETCSRWSGRPTRARPQIRRADYRQLENSESPFDARCILSRNRRPAAYIECQARQSGNGTQQNVFSAGPDFGITLPHPGYSSNHQCRLRQPAPGIFRLREQIVSMEYLDEVSRSSIGLAGRHAPSARETNSPNRTSRHEHQIYAQ